MSTVTTVVNRQAITTEPAKVLLKSLEKPLVIKDEFTVEPKPVDRLSEALKTVAWTAPVGAVAGYVADKALVAPSNQFEQALQYIKDHLPGSQPMAEGLAKFGLHLDNLVQKAGLSQDQVAKVKEAADSTPIADIMQHPEKLLSAVQSIDAGHLATNIGLGALFTGVIGAGMSQLFATDKISAHKTIAELETKIAKDKENKDVEKALGDLKKQKEIYDKRQEMADIQAEMAPEEKA